jgi:predicted peroxiredoxin
MPNATFIALGAVAIGLVVTAFCILVAVSASKKKKASKQSSQSGSPQAE